MENAKHNLVDAAQGLIQAHGYNGFSYRDVAEKVGIRTASIHYHFPSKEDLGVAVAEHYTEIFLERLTSISEATGDTRKQLTQYASLFQAALAEDGRMCLCGILSAESASLPESIQRESRNFITRNLDWLTDVFRNGQENGELSFNGKPADQAALLFASLEGAMIVAKGTGDLKRLNKISKTAISGYESH